MFEPVLNKRVYQYIVDQIQQQIYNGELKKGDKLPSEKELTELLNVSRTSVREALRALEVTGLIESKQGEGNYISGSMEDSLLEPLKAIFMLNQGTKKDLLELRALIEVKAAELAATRITDEEADVLRGLLHDMMSASLESHAAEMDLKLHYYIAEVTNNILIINILKIISSMMESFITNSRHKILENPNNSDMLMNSHDDIVQAIISRNPVRAKEAMSNHMRMVEKIVHP